MRFDVDGSVISLCILMSFCLLVGRLFGWLSCIVFKKGGQLHFQAPIVHSYVCLREMWQPDPYFLQQIEWEVIQGHTSYATLTATSTGYSLTFA